MRRIPASGAVTDVQLITHYWGQFLLAYSKDRLNVRTHPLQLPILSQQLLWLLADLLLVEIISLCKSGLV